jgi:hypothetical protein
MIRPIHITFLVTALFLGACGPASLTFRNNSASGNNGVDCTTTGTVQSAVNGLAGSLYYLPAGSANFNSVNDYIQPTYLDPLLVFLSDLNVPTRLNTLGFPDLSGGLLTTTTGTTLTANFALDLKSAIQLSPTDAAGDYQFGILSDDGAILDSIGSNGTSTTIINNDGLHPTLFGCATQVVHFDTTTQLNIEMKYYQGPPNEVALMLLWRKIPTGSSPNNQYCGDSGNTTFFNPTNSQPEAEYNNMLALGWAPLQTQNFVMPQTSSGACN